MKYFGIKLDGETLEVKVVCSTQVGCKEYHLVLDGSSPWLVKNRVVAEKATTSMMAPWNSSYETPINTFVRDSKHRMEVFEVEI